MYHHYSPQLYQKAFAILKDTIHAEETVQEIFLRIWQKRESLDVSQNFAGLLSTMATHQVLDIFRKIKRDRKLLDKFKHSEENYTITDDLDHKQTAELYHRALTQLSPQQYKVYHLCKVEGRSYKEAAETLGISTHTIKEYLVNANKTIRGFLTNHISEGSAFTVLLLLKNFIK